MTASLELPVYYISCPDDNNDFIEAIPPETRELVRKQQTSLMEEQTADPGGGGNSHMNRSGMLEFKRF